MKLVSRVTSMLIRAGLLWLFAPAYAYGQLLPPDWQKAVVLIESQVKVNEQVNFQALGTGFLVGRTVEGKPQKTFLVTAKHVVAVALSSDNIIHLRIDDKAGGFQRVQIHLASAANQSPPFVSGMPLNNREQGWLMHLGFDIAVVDVSSVQTPPNLDNRVFDVSLLAEQKDLENLSLAPTYQVFVIVYDSSFGLRLVRSGMISALVPGGTFLVEARNIHGDSGSPVVLQPVLSAKPGVIAPVKPLIVGLVSEVFSKLEPIGKFGNTQTDLTFPQPMNLSLVQPSTRILELISRLAEN